MWILLFFISAFFTKATGQLYYLSKENLSSSNAASMCNLATPLIKFTTYGQEVDLTNSNILPITEQMWVGFVIKNTTFVYKGCSNIRGLSNLKSTVDIQADPGHCYSFCKTRYIGIGRRMLPDKTACVCLTKRPYVLHLTSCTVACAVPQGTLCGNGNNDMSIYEKVPEPHTQSFPFTEDGQCLAYKPSSSESYLFWVNCSMLYQRICQTGRGYATNVESGGATWETRMRECINFTYWTFPADPSTDLTSVQDNGGQLWIGAIRSYSMFTVAEDTDNVGIYLQGYIDTSWQLHFTSQSDSRRLRALCIGSTSNSPSSSTRGTEAPTQTSNLATTISYPSTIRTTMPSESGSSTRSNESPESGLSKATKSKDSNGAIVAVYVVVPSAALVIAVATGCFIWRRRRKRPEKHLRSSENNRSQTYNETSLSKGTIYSLDDITSKEADATLRHDYLILEPVNENAAIQGTQPDQDDDGEYDTTESAVRGNINGHGTDNIYNRLDDVSDDTYNHTNTLNIRGDNTYNLTGNCGDETTYNTAELRSRSKNGNGVANSESRQANDVDDTYNHIDGAVSQLEHGFDTDDTYNTPECYMRDAKQVANAYAYANPSVKTPVVSPDKGNMKYDYAFAEPGVTGGSTKPIRFKLDQPAAAGNYAFATEPSASADNQLAKPSGY